LSLALVGVKSLTATPVRPAPATAAALPTSKSDQPAPKSKVAEKDPVKVRPPGTLTGPPMSSAPSSPPSPANENAARRAAESPPAEEDARHNRQVAQELLDRRLGFRAKIPGKPELDYVRMIQPLPGEPFWITAIHLSGPLINDDTLRVFAGAQLRAVHELTIVQTSVQGSGIAHLRGMMNLEQISVRGSGQFRDLGLEALAAFNLRCLEAFDLSGTDVGDTGVRHFEGLANLHTLTLADTRVSDACVPSLCKLKNLQSVHLERTRVTDEGARPLRVALPNCQVHREGLP
jgi:hypothetical protein